VEPLLSYKQNDNPRQHKEDEEEEKERHKVSAELLLLHMSQK